MLALWIELQWAIIDWWQNGAELFLHGLEG